MKSTRQEVNILVDHSRHNYKSLFMTGDE